jgi:hypothetical protein
VSAPAIVAVLGYAAVGIVIGSVTLALVLDDAEWIPARSEPAVAFAAGLLWPVTAALALAYSTWRIGCSVGGGFVALWRHWRRAQARRGRAGAA